MKSLELKEKARVLQTEEGNEFFQKGEDKRQRKIVLNRLAKTRVIVRKIRRNLIFSKIIEFSD